MKFNLEEKNLKDIQADFALAFVENKNLDAYPKAKDLFKMMNYKGEGTCLDLANRTLYVELKARDLEEIKLCFANAYKALKGLDIKSLKTHFIKGKCTLASLHALAQGFIFASYEYDKYKSEKKSYKLEEILIAADEFEGKEYKRDEALMGLEIGQIVSNACSYAKDIVNEIPAVYTPLSFEADAKNLAKEIDALKCTVYDEHYLEKEGMNAFLAVNKASPLPPRLIHLEYKPKNPKFRAVFVGKGLTYDSGGLSLKPGASMVTMKSDKAGGAAVMGILKAISSLGLDIEVHGVIGATENMIGSDAYKPDDVLKSREGKTIEVRNTDAEGRLVLVDCLSFAQDLKPDLLVDLATLTGACVVALGEQTSGIMGNNEELQDEFYKASKMSGDLACVLHFNKYLRELLKSDIADISNVSSARYGGAQTAGIFLDNFIRDEYKDKWLHLDIAGPAFVEKEWGYHKPGATAAGVRMCITYLLWLLRSKEWA